MDTHTAYIGIGSNQGNPLHYCQQAMQDCDTLPHCRVMAVSRLYRSTPVGPVPQACFINAVLALQTMLTAPELLTALQELEWSYGRQRHTRWGPRTLDLDILLYNDTSYHEADLIIPHPELRRRLFVLYPLRDIAPGLAIFRQFSEADWAALALHQDCSVFSE